MPPPARFAVAAVGLGVLACLVPAVEAQAAPRDRIVQDACGDWLPAGSTCGYLSAPRDWADPQGSDAQYRIAFARIPAEKPAQRVGILAFNPGGPGASAYENILWVQSLLPQQVRDRFDILAWDPRGVGLSDPEIVGCKVPPLQPPATGAVDWPAWVDEYVDAHEEAARECLSLNEEHADFVGTWQLVRDLDALREGLGEERLSFLGMSYGTTVGRAYAQAFPERVDRLVLDSNISPRSSIGLWAWEHAWDDPLAIRTALEALGPKYPKLHDDVMAALDLRALPDGAGGKVSRWDVGKRLIEWASFQSTWDSMRVLLDAVDAALRAESPADRRAAGATVRGIVGSETTVRNWLPPLYTYVNCADFPDRPSREYLVWVTRTAELLGGIPAAQAALREGAQCSALPSLGRPLDRVDAVTLTRPPLVLNSLADNRTPWTSAWQMARAFPGAGLVTYAGTQHIAYGRLSPCVDEPIDVYLATGRVPGRVDCPLVWPGNGAEGADGSG